MGLNIVILVQRDQAALLEKSPRTLLDAVRFGVHFVRQYEDPLWREYIDGQAKKHNEPALPENAFLVQPAVHVTHNRVYHFRDNYAEEMQFDFRGPRMRVNHTADGTKLDPYIYKMRLNAGRYDMAIVLVDYLHQWEESPISIAFGLAHLPVSNTREDHMAWYQKMCEVARANNESWPHHQIISYWNTGTDISSYYVVNGGLAYQAKVNSYRRRRNFQTPVVLEMFTPDHERQEYLARQWVKGINQLKFHQLAKTLKVGVKDLRRFVKSVPLHREAMTALLQLMKNDADWK